MLQGLRRQVSAALSSTSTTCSLTRTVEHSRKCASRVHAAQCAGSREQTSVSATVPTEAAYRLNLPRPNTADRSPKHGAVGTTRGIVGGAPAQPCP